MSSLSPELQRLRTLQAMRAAGLNLSIVWMRYFQLSGDADELDIDAYLNGLTYLTLLDRDLVAHAVNELINEQPRPAAPYSTNPDNADNWKELDGFGVLRSPEALTESDERDGDGRGQCG
ncbi:hypothetical protein MN0502_01860 [Arthrobacter sp. MN05-02]|nr:hypothetical protein MN0502_01860 [Arthrobacter sp. MN05-02]